MIYIDYAYVVFVDIFYLEVYVQQPYLVYGESRGYESFYFGGDYLDFETKIFNDLRIGCNGAFLQLMEFSQLSNNMWLPFDTPNFKKNMDYQFYESFLGHDYITPNLKKLIGQ